MAVRARGCPGADVHVLFLTDNFPPEVNAPASRTFEHCREWVRAGAQVTVITCVPNFPSGRVFAGYRNRPWQAETIEGIRVIRVWSYVAANEGFARRILDYTSFMLSAFLAAFWVRKVDIVVGTSPQFFTVVAAWAAARLKRVPWVFELRDLWPESIKAVGAMRDSFVLRFFERLELFLYRSADRIVTVTESFRSKLVERGIDAGKIDVVTNGVDLQNFQPRGKSAALEQKLGMQGRFVAGYIGTHGMAHGLDTLLDAAALLQADPNASDVMLVLQGDGARKKELQQRAGSMALSNVMFLDSVPKAEVADYWSLLDVSIVHLLNTELFSTVIPSKIFESMGMGIPLLHGVDGESAQIVRAAGVGEVFEAGNARHLVEGLLRLRNDRGRYSRCRENCAPAARRFDRATLAARMLEILRKTTHR
jgi:glycosyltransferase involved in cell wall biosynthesis